MIRFVEKEEDQRRMLRLCEETAFGCKMGALIRSYGFDKGFACFWLEEGGPCAYCLVDGLLILSGQPGGQEEAREFLQAVGPDALIASESAARALGVMPSQQGEVLKKAAPPGEGAPFPAGEAPIREIYGLLEETGLAGEFEPFYLDLSLKLRRGTALALYERRGRELAGCAVVSAISGRGAVLSALAVREKYRRQGIGSALAARAESMLPGKTLYIFREQGKNERFYRQLGYAHEDGWAYADLRTCIHGRGMQDGRGIFSSEDGEFSPGTWRFSRKLPAL